MTTQRPTPARKSAARPKRTPAKAAPLPAPSPAPAAKLPKAPKAAKSGKVAKAPKEKAKKKNAGKDAVITQLKQRAERLGVKARKNSLRLAGLRLLSAQGDAELLAALKAATES